MDGFQGTIAAGFMKHFVEGRPASVRDQLSALSERYQTTDLVIATNCYAFEDRVRSYQLVADACAAAAPPLVAAAR